ncbi:MAG: hypothetical protein K2X82_08555 [Gemmataceae bacterium]|nr:hypothetical protein [Gemmataceae bacterium]
MAPLLACAWFALAPTAAPVPAPVKKPGLLYPTTVGTRWVYERTDAAGRSREGERTFVLTRSGFDGQTLRLDLDERSADGNTRRTYQVILTHDGAFKSQVGVEKTDRPYRIIRHPFRAGDRWKLNHRVSDQPVVGASTAWGVEEVRVPAGVYDAYRVDVDHTWLGFNLSTTYWYAPGVGLVKTVHNDGGGDWVTVLKAFEPGRR